MERTGARASLRSPRELWIVYLARLPLAVPSIFGSERSKARVFYGVSGNPVASFCADVGNWKLAGGAAGESSLHSSHAVVGIGLRDFIWFPF